MRLNGSTHLGYCTNIHPGESWPDVRRILSREVPRVRRRLGLDAPLGVGLRLAAAAADHLAGDRPFARLVDLLAERNLYVFSINGFPHGTFHATRVKEAVYRPDWREPERLRYTNRLADLLARLLPADVAFGSISTVPGAFKPRAATPEAVAAIARHLIDHAVHLVRIERATGRRLVLALEPEPGCLLETTADAVAFFTSHLFDVTARDRLAAATGLSPAAAERALRRHLGVCLDACHAAVAFEEPVDGIRGLAAAGIAVAKLQISAGLVVPRLDAEALERLAAFAEPVYLHQVVERGPAGLKRFNDLPEAMAAAGSEPQGGEWRVHFHVPVFLAELGTFASTQPFLAALLTLQRDAPFAAHCEVETYTWDVLPAPYRTGDIAEAIARELRWTLDRLAPPSLPAAGSSA
jgi:sugar phosphate isomerase/epimerase